MFDIFYSGTKPNLSVHEQPADSIAHARSLSRTRFFWWTNYLTDYSGFDFLFEPPPWQAEYTHAWPSQWQRDSGTYLVPTAGTDQIYYNSSCTLTRLPTQDNWIVPANCDTDAFDFSWHPDYSEPDYQYQFGTQHQRTGGPQYVRNKDNNAGIKFVDQIRAQVITGSTPIIEIDHLDNNSGQIKDTVRTVRYFDNYLDTLTRIANTVTSEYVWIVSSVCDYSAFDFSWHPEQWQATMLHVFASDNMKFGDTFYMHVPSFRARIGQFELLDWYDVNFVGISVPRRPVPVVRHEYDTQVEAVKNNNIWAGPLIIFTTQDNDITKDNDIIKDIIIEDIPAVSLWREQTKTIVPLSAGASTVIVPRTCVPYIKKQLYDYPYIDRTQRHMSTDNLLDIVFIDNGEPNADDNYLYLKWAAERANSIRIHRSSGVTGRVAAYQAAAKLSTTPWFFAVFAKLEVSSTFDWRWQPDRLQEPKHYIFHAYNPVNGLEYGHQAMIAYNRKLVLENTAPGLDFTLDQAHEVVPIVSGVANYHYSKWVAWRTAFRECIKLRHSLPDVENKYRLTRWLTPANTVENSEYSVWGAEDAVEYYDSVAGNFAELRKSYDWAWLASYALLKRNLIPSQ
jgi:hypothetical protein